MHGKQRDEDTATADHIRPSVWDRLVLMQGLYASLELLPTYRGVDPDVDLFASGLVQDDAGEWEGGTALAAAPAEGDAAGPPRNHPAVLLSPRWSLMSATGRAK